MPQHRDRVTRLRAPRDGGPVRGAAEQVAPARAEAAAVDPVAVTRERGERELGEVLRGVNAKGFVAGAGRQEGGGEGAAADLVRVVPERADHRHHLVTGMLRWLRGSLARWRKMLKHPPERRERRRRRVTPEGNLSVRLSVLSLKYRKDKVSLLSVLSVSLVLLLQL